MYVIIPTSYIVYRTDQSSSTNNLARLGGVLIAVRKSISSSIIDLSFENLESIFVQVLAGKEKNLFGCTYLPPKSPLSLYEDYVTSLDHIMESNSFTEVCLCGDYNIPNIIILGIYYI